MAVSIRIAGVLIYHFVAFEIYGGSADGVVYFRHGIRVLDLFNEVNFDIFFNPLYYRGTSFLGTNFMSYYAAIFITLCGESFRGTFLLANFVGFTGLLLIIKTFMIRYPSMQWKKLSVTLLVLPSLWFWAASISKEIVVLLGLGLVIYNFFTKSQNRFASILGTAAGLAIITSVRPQILLVVLVAMILPELLGKGRILSLRNMAILILAIVGFSISMSFLGLQSTSVEAFEDKLIEDRRYNAYGGSVIAEEEPLTLSQAHIALINFLFRPFPWEVSSFTNLISAVEILFIYYLIYTNFSAFKKSLLNIRKDKLLMMSLVFIILYSVAGGLTAVNLGLIARVRIFVYPFLFILIYSQQKDYRLLARIKAISQRKEKESIIG
ncbi:hypothetical protein [Pontibacter amylolyticus]|uniref:hypothetical protein n=1 Tax=Pontibacter amylolyticus TaxID=1424080 RepID=UPI001664CF60|nr:hypothetical protein [Pontibacter amylolyticus]